MPHLYRVLVPVSDIARAALFYGQLLEQDGQRVSPGRHYFDCEGTILACYDPKADGDGHEARPNPECIYIAVDDVQAMYDACKAAGAAFPAGEAPGAGRLGEVAKRPWGELSFYVSDPFGNPLCFVSRASVFRG